MENPVCALVEKQFVTTFPGAVEFQLIGRVFTIYLRAWRGQLKGWGTAGPCLGHCRPGFL